MHAHVLDALDLAHRRAVVREIGLALLCRLHGSRAAGRHEGRPNPHFHALPAVPRRGITVARRLCGGRGEAARDVAEQHPAQQREQPSLARGRRGKMHVDDTDVRRDAWHSHQRRVASVLLKAAQKPNDNRVSISRDAGVVFTFRSFLGWEYPFGTSSFGNQQATKLQRRVMCVPAPLNPGGRPVHVRAPLACTQTLHEGFELINFARRALKGWPANGVLSKPLAMAMGGIVPTCKTDPAYNCEPGQSLGSRSVWATEALQSLIAG